MYNFYIILVLLSILSPIIAYNKADILKSINITNDIFYTSLALLIITFLIKLYKKDLNFKINDSTKKITISNNINNTSFIFRRTYFKK